MADSRDAEIVRSAYEALNAGDAEGALAPLAADAEWHESAAMPDGGVYRGPEAIGAFLGSFMESWDHIRQEIEDTVVSGDRVGLFIHLRARGRGSGIVVDRRYAHVWTMRDGHAVRVDAYDEPADAREALVAETPQAPASTTVKRNAE